MKSKACEKLNGGRIREGFYASEDDDGVRGAFCLIGPLGRELRIISSGVDSLHNWEHVSVSLGNRTPTWIEMCFVKDLFWGEEECVVQYHPPRSEYVNIHPNCLHLWKPLRETVPVPPLVLL
jgi:hypothetical protein